MKNAFQHGKSWMSCTCTWFHFLIAYLKLLLIFLFNPLYHFPFYRLWLFYRAYFTTRFSLCTSRTTIMLEMLKGQATQLLNCPSKTNPTFPHLFHYFICWSANFHIFYSFIVYHYPYSNFILTSESMLLTGTMICGGFCRQSCYFSSVFRLVSWIGTWQTWKFPILLYSTQILKPFGLMNHRLRLHQHRARPPM